MPIWTENEQPKGTYKHKTCKQQVKLEANQKGTNDTWVDIIQINQHMQDTITTISTHTKQTTKQELVVVWDEISQEHKTTK